MEKLTKQEAIQHHREMWKWIADKTRDCKKAITKDDYLTMIGRPDFIYCDCYCCEYVMQNTIDFEVDKDCSLCPLQWPSTSDSLKCLYKTNDGTHGGLYDCWFIAVMSNDWFNAALLADEIANLPERMERMERYL